MPPVATAPSIGPAIPAEHALAQLERFAASAVRRYSAGNGAVPPECTAGEGAEMTVEEAFRTGPVPHAPADGGVCRCAYLPLFN